MHIDSFKKPFQTLNRVIKGIYTYILAYIEQTNGNTHSNKTKNKGR